MSDITDRKLVEEERFQMERRLLHAQKLESLELLAGGIAHDFNNLLTAILGNLDIPAMLELPANSICVHGSSRPSKLRTALLNLPARCWRIPEKVRLS